MQARAAEEPERVRNNESFIQTSALTSSSWVVRACGELHQLLIILKKKSLNHRNHSKFGFHWVYTLSVSCLFITIIFTVSERLMQNLFKMFQQEKSS